MEINEQEKREKVIKELECCVSLNHNGPKCANCDYADEFHNGDCETYLLSDALALLKAQEPVEPIKANGVGYWCECGWYLGIRYSGISGSVKYCANCGRKVKWE